MADREVTDIIERLTVIIIRQAKGDLTDALILARAFSCDLFNTVRGVLKENAKNLS